MSKLNTFKNKQWFPVAEISIKLIFAAKLTHVIRTAFHAIYTK